MEISVAKDSGFSTCFGILSTLSTSRVSTHASLLLFTRLAFFTATRSLERFAVKLAAPHHFRASAAWFLALFELIKVAPQLHPDYNDTCSLSNDMEAKYMRG